MLEKLCSKIIKRKKRKISESEIFKTYELLLDRSPSFDEIAHWTAVGADSTKISKELQQHYEFIQKQVNKLRVLIPLSEFKIFVMQNDLAVGAGIIKTKTFESHVAKTIRDNLTPGGVFLDLGANIGFFTLLAASIVGRSGKVISIEPNVQNLQLIYASILENNFENIRVYPFAVSDRPQILNLTSFGSNGLVRPPSGNQLNSQFIQSIIIDELLQNEERIDLIKIDIEGYEPLAFMGMTKLIQKHNPIIISEFNPWHIEHGAQVSPKSYLSKLSQNDYSLGIIEATGYIVSDLSIDFIMDYWMKIGNPQCNLDLIAYKKS